MNARVTGDPEAPRKLNPELNPALEEVILHALERDPKQRYQTAAEMKRELDNLDTVEITHRDQRLRAPQPWKRRRFTAHPRRGRRRRLARALLRAFPLHLPQAPLSATRSSAAAKRRLRAAKPADLIAARRPGSSMQRLPTILHEKA